MPDPPDSSRADRILDAAGALLLRLGHRKVTIDDIARHARIGKGTVYLHWSTKDALFQALLARESRNLLDEVLGDLRRDPAAVLPHRLMHAMFLATERRPLMKALLTGDLEVLGRLAESPLAKQDAGINTEYFAAMSRHGLLRTDVANLGYTMQAAMLGFYLLDSLAPGGEGNPDGGELDGEAKADGLAHIIRCAFEPDVVPSDDRLDIANAEVISLFEQMSAGLGQWLHLRTPGSLSSGTPAVSRGRHDHG